MYYITHQLSFSVQTRLNFCCKCVTDHFTLSPFGTSPGIGDPSITFPLYLIHTGSLWFWYLYCLSIHSPSPAISDSEFPFRSSVLIRVATLFVAGFSTSAVPHNFYIQHIGIVLNDLSGSCHSLTFPSLWLCLYLQGLFGWAKSFWIPTLSYSNTTLAKRFGASLIPRWDKVHFGYARHPHMWFIYIQFLPLISFGWLGGLCLSERFGTVITAYSQMFMVLTFWTY